MTMRDREHLTAGIDVGASSIKVAIARSAAGEAGRVLALAHQRIRRRRVEDVVRETFAGALNHADLAAGQLDYLASTGDSDAASFATGHFYGMTTHARGALFLMSEARAVLDIGGLHARVMAVDERGKVLRQRMTSQCASGSGQFLENIARYLGVPLEDVGELSLTARTPEQVSSICAVLAETDVINMVSRGLSTGDILKSIHLSIAGRLTRLLRAVSARGVVALTGGLAHDTGLVAALNELLTAESQGPKALPALEVRTHPDAIYAGALGAALLGAYRHSQLAAQGRLDALAPVAL